MNIYGTIHVTFPYNKKPCKRWWLYINFKVVHRLFLYCTILSIAFAGFYQVGNTVSSEHQNTPYPICYGDYPSENLQLSDFNGYENGGDYKIIWIEMLATW